MPDVCKWKTCATWCNCGTRARATCKEKALSKSGQFLVDRQQGCLREINQLTLVGNYATPVETHLLDDNAHLQITTTRQVSRAQRRGCATVLFPSPLMSINITPREQFEIGDFTQNRTKQSQLALLRLAVGGLAQFAVAVGPLSKAGSAGEQMLIGRCGA